MDTRSTGGLFAQIVEGASEGIGVIDLERQTLYANATLAGLLHHTADELAGLSMLDTLDAVGQEQAVVVFQRDRDRQGVVLEQVQSMFVRHDGASVWCLVNRSPLRDADGDNIGSVDLINDITDRARVDEELRRRELLLAEAQRVAHLGSWECDAPPARCPATVSAVWRPGWTTPCPSR